MDCSMPGFPVLPCLLEFAQTHVHWVGDTIQPSERLSPPSPSAPNLSQHQGRFKWVSSSHQVASVLGVSASASVLPMNIQDWFPVGWTVDLLAVHGTLQSLLTAPRSKSVNSSALILLYGPTLTSVNDWWKNHSFDYMDLCRESDVSAF